jgi:indolepyruvate ferredoxin oxidoreductase
MAANMLVLGAAYQAGAIPISSTAIEEAILLNGVAVPMNTQAFRAGRLAVADPSFAGRVMERRPGAVELRQPRIEPELEPMLTSFTGETRRLVTIRVPELIEYQDRAYAMEYLGFVQRVWAVEQARVPGRTRLAEAVARYLFKLMAYKDEYEVARLHLQSSLGATLAAEHPDGVTIHYHLHPPILRALGWRRKIRLGSWFDTVFRLLTRLKGLRGTAFDPFGRAHVRRVERELIGEYRGLIEHALVGLAPETYETAVKLAELPDLIRGYEEVKLANVRRFREEIQKLGF